MKDRLRDIVVRQYEPLGRNHAELQEKLMASIPHAVPARQRGRRRPIGRLLVRDKAITIKERIFKMNRIRRMAAAIIIVAAVAGTVAFLTLGNGGASIAWADVQQHIRNARTLTFKMVTETKGMPIGKMTMEMTMMFKEPGLMRMEGTIGPSKNITIVDMQQNKMIMLMEAQKKAIVYDLTKLPAEDRKKQEGQNFLAGIKKLIEGSETELGEKEIDGRAVKGYRVEKGNQVFTIWADAETGQPVEMNLTMFQGESKATMSDFKFDVELDDALFSLDIPEGYTDVEEQQIEVKDASVDDVAELLRAWSRLRGGTFPDALTPSGIAKDLQDFMKRGKSGNKGLTKDDAGDVYSMTRAWMLLAQHGKTHYAGKGVTLGDAETAVFWYKPKDSETYKVIYGDLRIEDVAEEDLPTTQPAAEPEEATTMD